MNENLRDTLGWRLSLHARAAADNRGFDRREILLAAADPELLYTCNNYGPDREAHIRGHLCVIVNAASKTVITVMLHSHEYRDDAEVRQLAVQDLSRLNRVEVPGSMGPSRLPSTRCRR